MKKPPDLTEVISRRKDEAEVNEEQDFATLVVNSTDDGILAYDRQFRYTLWNPAMERLSGFMKADVLGRNAFEVFPFLKETGMDDVMRRPLSGEKIFRENVPYVVHETGRSGFFNTTNAPIRDEFGEIVGGLAVVRDKTQAKAEKDRLLEEIEELRRENERLRRELRRLSPEPGR